MRRTQVSGRRRERYLQRALEAAQGGDWSDIGHLLHDLAGVSPADLPGEVLEFLVDLLFWCHKGNPFPAAFPCRSRALSSDGPESVWPLFRKMVRKILSILPSFLETKTYPLTTVAAFGVPVPRSFRKSLRRTVWMRHFRALRRRLLGGHACKPARSGPSNAHDGPSSPVTLGDLSRLWTPAPGRCRLPFRRARFLRIGRLLCHSTHCPGFGGRLIPSASETVESTAAGRSPVVRRNASVDSWGALGPNAARFLEELTEAVAEELRAVRRLAFAVSRSRRRVVLSLHNAASAACSGWAFEDVDRQLGEARAAELFTKGVRDRLLAQTDRENTASGEPMVQALWAAWQERLIKPKALHGLWEARGRSLLGGADEFSQAVEVFRDLFPGMAVHGAVEAAPWAWSGWVSPHQQVTWRIVAYWRREKRALWSWGFRCLKALLQEAQDRLDRGGAEAVVVPWIDKFFISSKREADLGYLELLMDWLCLEGLFPIIFLWEDTTHRFDPSLALALRRHWPSSRFMGFGVFGDGSWTRRDAEGILIRTAEPGRLYILRPLDDTHRPRSVEAVLYGREDRRDFFSVYDSSWKDGTYAFYAGTQAAMLTSIATEPESIPPWVVVNGVRRPLGSSFRRAVRRRVLGGDEDERVRPLTARFFARFANLL